MPIPASPRAISPGSGFGEAAPISLAEGILMGVGILFPVFVQMLLTLVLLMGMGRGRSRALNRGEVQLSDIALDSKKWPDETRKFGNCYSNQFEMPVLFYVLCLAALQTANADYLMVLLAWIFVITRIVHAFIHTTSNNVRQRGAAFALGFFVVLIMLLLLAGRLLLASL
jgi:hypothetical protein